MEQYPSNSKETRQQRHEPADKKVERVVQSEVVRRKKPLGKRMLETFIGGDARGVWGYLAFDILVPAAKDTFADAFTEGIERILFDGGRSSSRRVRSRGGGGSHVSYNQMSSSRNRDRRDDSRSISRRARATHNFDEIILDKRVEAEEVIDQLYELVSKFDQASVSDLYEMVGISSNFTDNKYGWTDLRGAGVSRLPRGGYLLDLPRPEPLD